jgi:uncharacterized damage-inducible protein DinB
MERLFEELLEAWRYTRDGVVAEVENLPDAAFDGCPPGLGRSAIDIANHIVESSRLMAGELGRTDGDFLRKSYPDLIAEHVKAGDMAKTKAEAVDVLRRTHAEGDATLRSAGVEQMMMPIRQFNGVPASRMAWLHHGISHEEYHRGQIALYARLFGEKPALTKLIDGG